MNPVTGKELDITYYMEKLHIEGIPDIIYLTNESNKKRRPSIFIGSTKLALKHTNKIGRASCRERVYVLV